MNILFHPTQEMQEKNTVFLPPTEQGEIHTAWKKGNCMHEYKIHNIPYRFGNEYTLFNYWLIDWWYFADLII